MNKILILVISVFALNASADVQHKVGFIQERKVVLATSAWQEFEEEITQGFADRNVTMVSLVEQIGAKQNEIEDLEKQVQSSELSAESRTKKNSELISKRVLLKKMIAVVQHLRTEIWAKQEEIAGTISPIVKSVAESNGFSVIYKLDQDASLPMKDRSLLYLDPAFDITDDVIKALGASVSK